MPISVVAYDPSWPMVFESLRAAVLDAGRDIVVAVEHVGSTSVPGLAAKPIIDLDVIVRDRDVAEGIARLASLDYRHRGDLGIAQREAFEAPVGTPTHNLYLCPASSPALANHLAVRDYLRANAEAARAYGELKRRLAAEHAHDIDRYIEGKTSFLVGVLHEVGFGADALDAVTRMNRVKR